MHHYHHQDIFNHSGTSVARWVPPPSNSSDCVATRYLKRFQKYLLCICLRHNNDNRRMIIKSSEKIPLTISLVSSRKSVKISMLVIYLSILVWCKDGEFFYLKSPPVTIYSFAAQVIKHCHTLMEIVLQGILHNNMVIIVQNKNFIKHCLSAPWRFFITEWSDPLWGLLDK